MGRAFRIARDAEFKDSGSAAVLSMSPGHRRRKDAGQANIANIPYQCGAREPLAQVGE
jgi:hypothetical protein